MKTLLIFLLTLVTAWTMAQPIKPNSQVNRASAGPKPVTTRQQTETITVLGDQAVTLDLDNFDHFRQQMMPLINQMAAKKLVGLGEGTHGTSEFYKIRYWITKILVEEKGFNQVVFENDYADSYRLNQAMPRASASELDALMKQYLLAIWRNQEVKELLSWIQTHNRSAKKPVTFGGMDAMFMSNDARVLQELTRRFQHAETDNLTQLLVKLAVTRDSIWYNANRKDFAIPDSVSNANLVQGYETIKKLEPILARLPLSTQQRDVAMNMAKNIFLQLAGPYTYITKKIGSFDRDSCMAVMATRFLHKPEDKVIIWAHDFHVAHTSIYDGAVGGTGGYIEQMYPGQYFALGTGTATGTFAATDDRFITHASQMKTVSLAIPADSLWEGQLAQASAPAFYMDLAKWPKESTNLTYRAVGYGPKSGKSTHDKSHPVSELFDAYLFIRDTKAAQFIK
ncbi:erythromycin esterase family protein [Spirosoma agri]|uniref:Erythromycin esterase family protein n=1 Tax=Spirosoma agri TaxID=1987381 RepID=A0A6M0ITX7_9BACT|nr:erythromycin esterase family protein [Spirosoma agri]NEU70763.1 erythromycin esterase family protein [Spirosoma agri]